MKRIAKLISFVLTTVLFVSCFTLISFAKNPDSDVISPFAYTERQKTKTFSIVYTPSELQDLVFFSADITVTGTYSQYDDYAQIDTIVVGNFGGLNAYADTVPYIILDFTGPETAYVAFINDVDPYSTNGVFAAYIIELSTNGNMTITDVFTLT